MLISMIVEDNEYNSKTHMQLYDGHYIESSELTPIELDEFEIYQKFLKDTPELFENSEDYNSIKEFINGCNETPTVGNNYVFVRLMTIVPGKMINYAYFAKPYKLVGIHDDGRYIFDINGKYQLMPARRESNDMLNFSLFFNTISEEQEFRSDLMLQFGDWNISKPKIITEKSTQVKGSEPYPKLSKPSKTGFQKHPYTGRLVGENSISSKSWYHGTPDVARIEQDGGFTQKYMSISYISDTNKWKELQEKLSNTDRYGNEYFTILDEIGKLVVDKKLPKPIFFTDMNKVAASYADSNRAFDYQNAIAKVIKVNINAGKILKISAHGQRFSGIIVDDVISGFVNSGISKDQILTAIAMFERNLRNNKLTTDAIATIAQMFDFDTIDVVGVYDSYRGGTIKSTVRIVFDPSRITIIDDNT